MKKKGAFKKLTACVFLVSCCSAHAIPLKCYEDRVTNAMQCIAPSEVRASNLADVRMAPLYNGGPRSMAKTPYTIHTNCKTGVTHLKDSAGVSFAGGDGNETRAVRTLKEMICEAPLPQKKR